MNSAGGWHVKHANLCGCFPNIVSPVQRNSQTKERMEAGNFGRAQGEMQEPDSANHGKKKQWPSMTPEEEDLISRLHHLLGDRWELIAKRLPERTAEEVESYWKIKEGEEFEEHKIYKPVCTRLSPSFKFTMDEPLEDTDPSQTGS